MYTQVLEDSAPLQAFLRQLRGHKPAAMFVKSTQQFTQLHPQRINGFFGEARFVLPPNAGAVHPPSNLGLDGPHDSNSIHHYYFRQKGSMDQRTFLNPQSSCRNCPNHPCPPTRGTSWNRVWPVPASLRLPACHPDPVSTDEWIQRYEVGEKRHRKES